MTVNDLQTSVITIFGRCCHHMSGPCSSVESESMVAATRVQWSVGKEREMEQIQWGEEKQIRNVKEWEMKLQHL